MTVSPRKVNVTIDVSGHAPRGCRLVSADLFVPTDVEADPVLWCCVPGGGMSRDYFDLDVAPSVGQYSMARFAAERGHVVLTIDPPGVGQSDLPENGYELTPRAVADVLHCVVTETVKRLAVGEIPGMVPMGFRIILGVGHSAGGLLVACQQGRHQTYGAVALLGFSNGGLPAVLTAEEAAFTNRPDDLVRALPEFVRTRFGDPLPQWSSARSGMVSSDGPADLIEAATAKADTRLLALVGMTALVPGSIRPELDQIDVPTLVALGEDDIAGEIAALPGQLPACHDLTLFVLAGAGHNHNVADTRLDLWRRLLRWIDSIAPTDVAID
jgi:pimeloyl-ACP methyl ester carboxylesterase